MTHTVIDRKDVIELFDRLIEVDSPHRLLYVVGDAKMGKTHLMTVIFPSRASEVAGVFCTVVDVRSRSSVPEILHNLSSIVGEVVPFPKFEAAYQEWLNRPIIQASGFQALFSKISLQAQAGGKEESSKINPRLTSQFVADLRAAQARPIVLLVDALDSTEESVRDWLINMLLVQLAPLRHVRIVVASRVMPEVAGSYAAYCRTHQLRPVKDEREYIEYCRQSKVSLVEQSIRDFARATGYAPGLFADLVASLREE